MNTIRQRLTRRLLLGWALLLGAGGGLAYWCAQAALTRQFDDTLRAKAMALMMLVEQDHGRIIVEDTDPLMRAFDADARAGFFQIWDANSNVVARSKSLADASLPLRCGPRRRPEFQEVDLPADLDGRAVVFKFTPQAADEAANPATAVDAILAVAIDREGLDRTLGALGLVLISCGALILLLTAVTVPRLLRKALAPLDELANQAQRIQVNSLSARFPAAGLPGELAPIAQRLNDLLQRLQTAFERERQFSDDLAHEFRTPIAELRSLAELSLKWPEARQEDSDRHVLTIAVHMESIINRLLAMARSEQGQASLAPARVNLAGLVAAVCQPLQSKAASRQLTFAIDVPASHEVHSDSVLLRSILMNLVDNAVEYAPPRATVRLESERQPDRFALCVANPVEHLSAVDVPHLFERFWRKDAARSNAAHAGLGLSLARALATSLGLTLKAQLNGNATLVMTLSGPAKLEPAGLPNSPLENAP